MIPKLGFNFLAGNSGMLYISMQSLSAIELLTIKCAQSYIKFVVVFQVCSDEKIKQ